MLAVWIPRAYRSRFGWLIDCEAEPAAVVTRDITHADAKMLLPEHNVCYDRDGLYRYRETIERTS